MADIWSSLAPSLATIGGAAIATNANNTGAQVAGGAAVQSGQIQADAIAQATSQAQYYSQLAQQYLLAGNQDAADAMQANANAALATVKQYSDASKTDVTNANTNAIQTYNGVSGQTAPGVSYLRQAVADQGSLTPAQQEALKNQRLSDANAIHSSNFAGSGRTAAALLKQNETDFTNAALDTNRARALTAANTLAGANITANNNVAGVQANTGTQLAGINQATGTQSGNIQTQTGQTLSSNDMTTGTQSANVNTTLGTNISNNTTAAGKAIGTGVQTAGLYTGQADVANGAVQGKAIGDIGSQIASQSKLSRYGDASTSSGSSSSNSSTDKSGSDWA